MMSRCYLTPDCYRFLQFLELPVVLLADVLRTRLERILHAPLGMIDPLLTFGRLQLYCRLASATVVVP